MKNSNQKSASETVCHADNSEAASEMSTTCEVHDGRSPILRVGVQKTLQAAIRKVVDNLQNRSGIVGEDGGWPRLSGSMLPATRELQSRNCTR